MKARDKAIELINKYKLSNQLFAGLNINQAKKCAAICVDEIILSNKTTIDWLEIIGAKENVIHGVKRNVDYLRQVKVEINELK